MLTQVLVQGLPKAFPEMWYAAKRCEAPDEHGDFFALSERGLLSDENLQQQIRNLFSCKRRLATVRYGSAYIYMS